MPVSPRPSWLRLIVAASLCPWVGACSRDPRPAPAAGARLEAKIEKVSGAPVPAGVRIVGRVSRPSRVVLLTSDRHLYFIDPLAGKSDRVAIKDAGAEELWGLAQSTEDSLWTLSGRQRLLELSPAGRVMRTIPLSEPHLGLFSWKNRLVYQPVVVESGRPLLETGPPGEEGRGPLGPFALRPLALPMADVLALSLVTCGSGDGPDLPCWYRDEARFERVKGEGPSETIDLTGLGVVATQPRSALEIHEAIRDVYIAEDRVTWVLAGERPGAASAGTGLIRLSALSASLDLPVVARMILQASSDSCALLTRDGDILRVTAR